MRLLLDLINQCGCWFIRLLVGAYRLILKPWLPLASCRFQPTCSQFLLDAVAKYGFFPGLWRGARRLSRCRPGCPGGYDPA
ncbi:MAG: membrane protein insertion efficiency factor YidD [Gemmataceae bacterium]|nr:membrane protein insertion efficiency factor YidD [Gemmataceae bacterium]